MWRLDADLPSNEPKGEGSSSQEAEVLGRVQVRIMLNVIMLNVIM